MEAQGGKVLRQTRTEPEVTSNHDLQEVTDMSLHGSLLVLARVLWIVVVVLVVGLSFASIPSYFASLHHILNTTDTPDLGGQLTPSSGVQELQAAGLSLDFYARFSVLLTLVFLFVSVAVGFVIFWRRSDDRMALLASFTLVLFAPTISTTNLDTLPAGWMLLIQSVHFLGEVCLGMFFYLFPSGQFVPRWARWLAVGLMVYWMADIFLPASQFSNSLLSFVLFLGLQASQVVAQIYRYRRVSSPVQRQQTKWVVWGIAVGLGGVLIEIVVIYVFLRLFFPPGALTYMLGYAIFVFLGLLFPLSIGIAILRSRLWDIDVLINRTLVYGMLTASLAVVYFGLVIALQYLLGGFMGQTNGVAIVGSTLAIAALFQPLRQRFQGVIDRRFYRRKYDAARTLAAFSTRLRNEVDLEQLSEELVAVVEETIQPMHVSLWLRKSENGVKGNENTWIANHEGAGDGVRGSP